MGSSRKEVKKLAEQIKKLAAENAAYKAKVEAQGLKLETVEDQLSEMSPDEFKHVNENYAKISEGGIIGAPETTIPSPHVCEDQNAHYDDVAAKCICNPGYILDATTGKCIKSDGIPEPEPTGQKDEYGINKIYADKQGGVLIKSDKFSEQEFTRNYASGKPSENSYECEYKDSNKLENEEVTLYCQINGFKNEPDTMSVKLLGNKHSDGSKDKWLIHELMTDGSDNKTFEIEDPHPNNHGNHQKPLFNIDKTIVGQVVGFKAITYIDANGKRHAETWLDIPTSFEAPANKWRKYIDIKDVASLDHGFVNATNGGALLRIDGTKKGDKPTTKFMSIREIVPAALGGTGPIDPNPQPEPEPEPEPQPSGNVLYDSSIGKWNRTITITAADPDFPKPFSGGKGMEAHASGNPVFKFDGTGVGTLEAGPGHGRMYIDINNNGSIFEYELRFNDTNIENHTCQLRSRHQEGEPPENRQGGDSFKIDLKTVGLKLEKFHNEHISGEEKPHGLPLKVGEWIKVKLTDKPDYTKGEIYQSIELNGQKVIEGTQKNLPPYLLKKEDYDKRSYLWLRVNNIKKGSVSFRNPKLTSI